MPLIPLQSFSNSSNLPNLSSIPDLVTRAANHHVPALALTDLGTLHNAIAFHRSCRAYGVQPILGCVLPIALPGQTDAASITLYAENKSGFKNLIYLSSQALCGQPPGYLPWQAVRAPLCQHELRHGSSGRLP